jgi:putative FmdB family regulatory protein
MPIFEYRCPQCGATFEQFTQRPNDASRPTCPRCGAQSTERLLSLFSGRGCGAGCGSTVSGGG